MTLYHLYLNLAVGFFFLFFFACYRHMALLVRAYNDGLTDTITFRRFVS